MDSYNALIICSDPAGLFAAMQFESFGIEDCYHRSTPVSRWRVAIRRQTEF